MSITLMAGCKESSEKTPEQVFNASVTPPHVEKIAKEFTLHGDKRIDEYYWLNQRDNPKVIDYLNAENAYVDTIMAGTKDLQAKLFSEMKGRIKEKDETVPYKDNGYWYYSRYDEGSQYPYSAAERKYLQLPKK
jgi:oligopeptidase B